MIIEAGHQLGLGAGSYILLISVMAKSSLLTCLLRGILLHSAKASINLLLQDSNKFRFSHTASLPGAVIVPASKVLLSLHSGVLRPILAACKDQ
eukprot:scaffold179922_cov20-Tisochrysis_lutea.AAC.1